MSEDSLKLSLIQKLEAAKASLIDGATERVQDCNENYNYGLDKAIFIIRQHQLTESGKIVSGDDLSNASEISVVDEHALGVALQVANSTNNNLRAIIQTYLDVAKPEPVLKVAMEDATIRKDSVHGADHPTSSAQQPVDWAGEVLELLKGRREELLFNYETNEYGQGEIWKTAADNVQRLIDTAPMGESSDAEIDAGFWEGEYKSIVKAAVEKMAELGHEVDPPEKMIEEAKYRLSRIHESRKSDEIEGGE